jgi:DNA-directed RNA polymerase specialized sigma24 family protein
MTAPSAESGSGEPTVQEAFRARAVQAQQLGYAVADIAAILGLPEETVTTWCSEAAAARSRLLAGAAGTSASPVPFNTAANS